MDYNQHRKDGELGTAVFDLKTLVEDPEQEEIAVPVLLGGKTRGTLKFDLRFFPVITPKKLADGYEEPLPESSEYECASRAER
jgi:Ca2+-dependent lipid-binding protein